MAGLPTLPMSFQIEALPWFPSSIILGRTLNHSSSAWVARRQHGRYVEQGNAYNGEPCLSNQNIQQSSIMLLVKLRPIALLSKASKLFPHRTALPWRIKDPKSYLHLYMFSECRN